METVIVRNDSLALEQLIDVEAISANLAFADILILHAVLNLKPFLQLGTEADQIDRGRVVHATNALVWDEMVVVQTVFDRFVWDAESLFLVVLFITQCTEIRVLLQKLETI